MVADNKLYKPNIITVRSIPPVSFSRLIRLERNVISTRRVFNKGRGGDEIDHFEVSNPR